MVNKELNGDWFIASAARSLRQMIVVPGACNLRLNTPEARGAKNSPPTVNSVIESRLGQPSTMKPGERAKPFNSRPAPTSSMWSEMKEAMDKQHRSLSKTTHFNKESVVSDALLSYALKSPGFIF